MSEELLTDRRRIAAYVAGGGTPAERAAVASWIADDPARCAELAAVERVWESVQAKGQDGPCLDLLWQRIETAVRVEQTPMSSGHPAPAVPSSRLPRLMSFRTFAALIVAVIVGVGGSQAYRSVTQRIAPATPNAYTTGNGQRADITLPDGSTVSLNVASRLEVSPGFSSGDRTVRLSGEALFTVAPQSNAPFTVIAGPATTRVLGTTFLVRHYATDSSTTVAVRSGRVAVNTHVLSATQQIEAYRNGTIVWNPIDRTQFTFSQGILTLDGVSLPKAIPVLNRWYDVDIQLGTPSLATRGVGGKFMIGSISNLVAILEWTLDVRVVQDGRRLTLYPMTR